MFKRILVTTLAYSFCVNSLAYQMLDEETTKKQQLQLSASLVEKAKKEFTERALYCFDLSKKVALEPSDLDHISLNKEELKTVFSYFSVKTDFDCVGDKADKYLTAQMVARSFKVNEYAESDDPDASKILVRGAGFFTNYIRYLPNYLAIDSDKRKELEKITKLNNVFDLNASLVNFKLIKP